MDPAGQDRERIRQRSEHLFLGTVADDRKMPGGAIGEDASGGIEEDRDSLLRIETADEEGEQGLGGHADLRSIERFKSVEARGVDPVGDDGEPVGIDSAQLASKLPHPFGDADRAAREPGCESVERQMPASAPLRHADTADDPGVARQRGGEPGSDVGVKEEALDERGAESSECCCETPDGPDRPAAIDVKADGLDPGHAEYVGEIAWAIEADDGWLPATAIEPNREIDERLLRAPDIEVGDRQGDRDRPVGPGFEAGVGQSSGQGLQVGASPGCDGRVKGLGPDETHHDGRGQVVQTEEFDFDLPDRLIAQQPVDPRDSSRLIVVRRSLGAWEHQSFRDLPNLLDAGDILVRNNTKVVPARLVGHRERTGGAWEGLFLRAFPGGEWEILGKTRGRPEPGERIVVGQGLGLELIRKDDSGRWTVRPDSDEPTQSLLDRHGVVPLPPYIRKGVEGPGDRVRYQTVFASIDGSVAAPTAGLHFTEDVFRRLAERGVGRVDITLHVGLGTFRPIEAKQIEEHALHAEWASLDARTADRLTQAKAYGGRIVAVGTTSARTLETASASGSIEAFEGETALYIRPGHKFHAVDALLTNFHLPKSSLLVLVSALAGVDLIRAAYAEAIREGYRFYSFGDAMLILP